jgi:hypothetical protein
MIVKIKKGKHLSNQLVCIPRVNLWDNGEIVIQVKFNDSCRYYLGGGDQSDWNKLGGCSWGYFPVVDQYMMHYNSSRFGWRYNPYTFKIEITPYLYNEGVRCYAEEILNIEPWELNIDTTYYLVIKPLGKDRVYYQLQNQQKEVLSYYIADQKVPTLSGWVAPGYFGGNKPAPQNINYLFKYL